MILAGFEPGPPEKRGIKDCALGGGGGGGGGREEKRRGEKETRKEAVLEQRHYYNFTYWLFPCMLTHYLPHDKF